MTRQQLEFAAAVHGYTASQMAWALEPAAPGECSWLEGCNEPVVPDGEHCVRHEAYLKAHMPKAVVR